MSPLLGRVGVPVIYTWPAGYPGAFGYTYDRESSEFTVYHFRQALRLIASIPEVEKIHLVAHSRGTDVAVSALREMTIAARAAGLDPREEFKLKNVVLAAPDLDVQVAEQRLLGDRISLSTERLTVYPADKAIGISAKLFESPRGRIGNYGIEYASDLTRSTMEFAQGNIAFINFAGFEESEGDRYGHSYFRDALSVSSDLVLMLRDDIDAGEPGRPLEHVGLKFWRIPADYPPSN
jgi:esterase/lipase superfamily enzyme